MKNRLLIPLLALVAGSANAQTTSLNLRQNVATPSNGNALTLQIGMPSRPTGLWCGNSTISKTWGGLNYDCYDNDDGQGGSCMDSDGNKWTEPNPC